MGEKTSISDRRGAENAWVRIFKGVSTVKLFDTDFSLKLYKKVCVGGIIYNKS